MAITDASVGCKIEAANAEPRKPDTDRSMSMVGFFNCSSGANDRSRQRSEKRMGTRECGDTGRAQSLDGFLLLFNPPLDFRFFGRRFSGFKKADISFDVFLMDANTCSESIRHRLLPSFSSLPIRETYDAFPPAATDPRGRRGFFNSTV